MFLKLFSVVMTIFVYLMAKKVNKKLPGLLFSPIIITPIVMIIFLLMARLPYEEYVNATSLFNMMLNVVTVAFAIPLYRNWNVLASNWRIILFSLMIGSLVAIVAGVLTSYFLGMGLHSEISIIPRSITMPIAVNLSESFGGIPTLTAVFVMLTSFAGVYLGPKLIKLFSFKHPLVIGMMYGMGANVLGATKAFESGDLAGSSATLSTIVGALMTVVWAFILTPAILTYLS
ncbi:LrgB family protein [Rummeliibacillus sp. TYF005]|uniref:LrgB family protein n=1 Tax=Rummeliibacillus sp. TYF005 TaxID=2058214 RepID=UPI000F5306A6|nr:LrgB family protein [Rummeliibacillus sp. TYF005]RPJ96595.1 LrgB family protein [Rummeliibacillus sp. TYF005]